MAGNFEVKAEILHGYGFLAKISLVYSIFFILDRTSDMNNSNKKERGENVKVTP